MPVAAENIRIEFRPSEIASRLSKCLVLHRHISSCEARLPADFINESGRRLTASRLLVAPYAHRERIVLNTPLTRGSFHNVKNPTNQHPSQRVKQARVSLGVADAYTSGATSSY